MATYLERYLRGEHTHVWDELIALGDQVREEPIYSDAWAVALETMRRVRHNLELVVPRLRTLGYVFSHDLVLNEQHLSMQEREWIESLPPFHTPPSPDIIEQMDVFEHEVAILPLSLRAFYQEVGGVNFIGWHQEEAYEDDLVIDGWPVEPSLVMEEFDPIFVEAFHRDLVEASEDWLFSSFPFTDDVNQMATEEDTPAKDEDYHILIAPDAYHKMNTSGGSPYIIQVSDAAADALLLNEWHQTNFVDYLRVCCSYAGLPGLEKIHYQPLYEKLQDLRAGMLPI